VADDSSKTCFVICPIGAPGSAERQRTETLIEYVVSPALEPLGYARPVRPTNSISQGSSRTRFVQHIEADDLVVADLTDANANVFYEVAARHVIEKPIVHLVIGDQLDEIPFDVNQVRAIPYQLDVQSANEALAKIRAQVEAIERTGEVGTNPLSQGFEVAAQKRSAVPVEQALGELRISFDELRAEVRAARSDPSLLAALGSSYGAGRYGAGTYGVRRRRSTCSSVREPNPTWTHSKQNLQLCSRSCAGESGTSPPTPSTPPRSRSPSLSQTRPRTPSPEPRPPPETGAVRLPKVIRSRPARQQAARGGRRLFPSRLVSRSRGTDHTA
jgi:hypothetical protein